MKRACLYLIQNKGVLCLDTATQDERLSWGRFFRESKEIENANILFLPKALDELCLEVRLLGVDVVVFAERWDKGEIERRRDPGYCKGRELRSLYFPEKPVSDPKPGTLSFGEEVDICIRRISRRILERVYLVREWRGAHYFHLHYSGHAIIERTKRGIGFSSCMATPDAPDDLIVVLDYGRSFSAEHDSPPPSRLGEIPF